MDGRKKMGWTEENGMDERKYDVERKWDSRKKTGWAEEIEMDEKKI